jgi:hypothetical protein
MGVTDYFALQADFPVCYSTRKRAAGTINIAINILTWFRQKICNLTHIHERGSIALQNFGQGVKPA